MSIVFAEFSSETAIIIRHRGEAGNTTFLEDLEFFKYNAYV